jgi:hypothetical protein
MVNHVTLAVGKGFKGKLLCLVKGFDISTLIDDIPFAGVMGSGLWEKF